MPMLSARARLVIFSDKAFVGIVAETYERVGTETGGIFLGKFLNNHWYIIETLDPGPNSIFRTAYFEYDTPYVNHLANKLARFYKNGLDLIGLWHRHPGGFSSFSSTDDSTNIEYARSSPNGAISALVNLDPDFRLTVYHVTDPLQYTVVNYQVGNSHIPGHLLETKEVNDFIPRKRARIHSRSYHREQLPAAIQANIDKTAQHERRPFWKKLLYGKPATMALDEAPRQASIDTRLVRDNDATKDQVLDLIEAEIDFLEAQLDYNYALQMLNDHEILISMLYVQQIEGYPKALEFVFGIDEQAEGYAVIDHKRSKYVQDFIHRYLNSVIGTTH